MAGIDRDRIEDRVLTLVRTASGTGHEADAIDLVASWLAPIADEIDPWVDAMADLETDPAFPGTEVERATVPVVAARISGGRPGPSLVLTGHVDTVPVGDPSRWTKDVQGQRDGDLLYGRGAADMKAGLVAAIEAFTVLATGDREFAGDISLVAVPGEEDGGTGTLAAIRRGWTGDRVIITEPTSGTDGPGVVIAHGGALTYSIRVDGRAAHAATREEGVSALDAFWVVHAALQRLERNLNDTEDDPTMAALGLPYPTTVGIVRGGTWASNVMEDLTAEVRVGVTVHETIAEAESRFEASLRDAIATDPWLSRHPPRIERTGAAFGSSRIDPTDPLVTAVAGAVATVTGSMPPLVGAPYGCDMALWMREAGAAALVYGPGDVANAHAADEHVSMSETATVAAVLIEVANRLQT